MSRNGSIELGNHLENRRAKFLTILAKHIQNFHRTLILRRRKRQQLMQRRRADLRKFYLLNFLELESRLLEMAPLIGLNETLQTETVNLERTRDDLSNEIALTPPTKIIRNPPQNLRFYEDIVSTYSDEEFFQTFRMSRHIFQLLCNQLRDSLQPNAPVKNLISLEKRCALSIYAFAAGDDYREIAERFDVSRTSVCKFTKKFAEALLEKLGPHLLKLPEDEEEFRDIREHFHRMSGLPPLCVGLLGACEINVSPQLNEAETYANVAGVTTLILQAVIDDKMLFRKVQMEAQGPTMLLNAPNEITRLGLRHYNGDLLPCFILTPLGPYKPKTWMVQPYEHPKNLSEIKLNDAVKRLHAVKQEAFQRLFSRWKILQRKGDLEPKTMILIANTCCALHNLLEEYGENFDYNWTEGIDMSHFDKLANCKQVASTSKTTADSKKKAIELRKSLARKM